MADPLKIVIPATVAAFVRPGTPVEERLRGAGGQPSLPPREQLLLLFCLAKDAAPHVRELAMNTLATLEPQIIGAVDGWDTVHPALLHQLAQTHGRRREVRSVLEQHPCLAEATRTLLQTLTSEDTAAVEVSSAEECMEEDVADRSEETAPEDGDDVAVDAMQDTAEVSEEDQAESDETDEEDEEYLSKYSLAQVMGIGEKIKMALTGDKEWRKILIKDSNKLVSSGVLKNPRITEPEVLNVLKSGCQNDEIMRLICANREWVKNYIIRKALIENPKTPTANALRYLATMNEKDIAGFAKSRNISSVIATSAKRLLMNKKR